MDNKMDKIISDYNNELRRISNTKIATELSYYCPLQTVLNRIAFKYLNKIIIVIPEAKKQFFGKPDFIILDADHKLIGAIEAKMTSTDLTKEEKEKQIIDYKKNIDNFILTDFYNFRLYNKNKMVMGSSVGTTAISNNTIDTTIKLLKVFLSKTVPEITFNKNYIYYE